MFFRCNSPCFKHLLLFLTGNTNIQRFLMGNFTGCLRDPVAGRPGDQMMGRSGGVRGRQPHMFFKIISETC